MALFSTTWKYEERASERVHGAFIFTVVHLLGPWHGQRNVCLPICRRNKRQTSDGWMSRALKCLCCWNLIIIFETVVKGFWMLGRCIIQTWELFSSQISCKWKSFFLNKAESIFLLIDFPRLPPLISRKNASHNLNCVFAVSKRI